MFGWHRGIGLVVALAILAFAASAASALAASPVPGSFTGKVPPFNSNDFVFFYVSADSTHVQDVSIPIDELGCTGEGSKTMQDHLQVSEVKIEAGAFGVTQTEKGRVGGYPVKFTFMLSGTFAPNGEEASGTYSEKIAFEGSTRACTSGTQPFTAKRDAQGPQTTAAPPAGSYTGPVPPYNSNDHVFFYVSANGTQLQDVSIPIDELECTGEGLKTVQDHLQTFQITAKLTAVGWTFKGAKTEKGAILEGLPVTIKFTFSGHFHSVNNEGVERGAGSYREDITFEGGSTRRCTTNNQPFTATRDSQPTQTTATPPAGSYAGPVPLYNSGDEAHFEVSANGTHLQHVSLPTYLKCTGEGGSLMNDNMFEIKEIAIKGKTTFKATVTGNTTISGKAALFSYTFEGHFHSLNAAAKERSAGTFREELSFEGSTRRCTTDSQPFSAVHT